MSYLIILFLLWIGFIHIQDGAMIRVDHSKNFKGFDYVVQKYLDPLRKLQADLPNHAIEMQIEFHDALPTYTKNKPQRRVIRVLNPRNPKAVKRSQAETTAAASETTTTTAAQTTTTAPAPADPVKVPVYMDDLKKALEDLEKKLNGVATTVGTGAATTKNGGPSCTGGGSGGGGGGGGDGTVNNMLQTPIRSIDNIMEILKKAIHIEHREPKPSENLEWLQVKIPKTRN